MRHNVLFANALVKRIIQIFPGLFGCINAQLFSIFLQNFFTELLIIVPCLWHSARCPISSWWKYS